ncbi:hypothetical protein Moror_7500 [Moniliophthora roreri MCA 2997]|uniref:Uncharacterized protein n=2 Tax=Moniliophthora roreri TaxID=221103 RepID=V2WB00_MONRO|nr:hypothetical protein Moror_7500 [Moniliophthora roreri MCA 2997]
MNHHQNPSYLVDIVCSLLSVHEVKKQLDSLTAIAIFRVLVYHLHTLFLFTRSDWKTIFLPATTFGTVTGPISSFEKWALVLVWVWTHLLQANVSNQNYSAGEDIINKPWRPLPAKRITERQAAILSLALALVEFVHDDCGLSHRPILKNVCNIGGYTTFETGATLIASPYMALDKISIQAVFLSGALIFTTIHAQDFADVDGDRQSGRHTLPIVHPEGSRVYILIMLVGWSIALSFFWDLGPICATALVLVGSFVGMRYYRKRDVLSDEGSYRYYNMWLLLANTLPGNSRFGVLSR